MKYRYNLKDILWIISNIIVFFFCTFTSIYIFFKTNHSGYEKLFLLPLVYLICFKFILSRVLFRELNVFILIFFAISFSRFVILPFMIVISCYYGGRSAMPPTHHSYDLALIIMMYELIVSSIFIYVLDKKERGIFSKNKYLSINKKNYIYWLFGIIIVLISILDIRIIKSFNFIIPKEDAVRSFSDFSIIQSLSVYGLLITKQIVFVMIAYNLSKKYELTKSKKYIYLVLLVAMMNILIYFGTNRSDVIMTAIVSSLTLYKLFGKGVKKGIFILCIVLVVTISGISAYRSGASISGNSSKIIDFTDKLQVYLGGPYNVAIAIETKEMFPQANKVEVLLFDIFRPMLGVNMLVKNLPVKYSNMYFNERIWLSIDRRSQIIPMVGQGNLFFGAMLSPILTLIFIRLAYYLNRKIKDCNRVEIFYFLNLSIARMGFMMGQNTMNMINDLSMNLFLFLIIYWINNIVSKIKTYR
ncbi:MAG: hypothetical protein E7E58_14340 [Paeniclostridium sordellii]|nr:hypothetical protein [Paeniclostridium sordellii]